jgi:hypothetical protein
MFGEADVLFVDATEYTEDGFDQQEKTVYGP